MSSDVVVIIPTYNEAGNITAMLKSLLSLPVMVDVLIVDDGSPDGTAQRVEKVAENNPGRVHLIERGKKMGLGTAYVTGFQYGLDHGYTYLCEMDCDFSHDPKDIPKLVEKVRSGEADVAIGSRYSAGISIINWPLSRLILSYAANVYARFITGLPIFDTTAGFKCLHRKVLESIKLNRVKSNGYAFQIEIHFRAWKLGYRIKEVSIIFRERKSGVSKMSKKIVIEAIWRVWALKWRSIFRTL